MPMRLYSANEKTNGQAVEQLVKDLGQLLEDYN